MPEKTQSLDDILAENDALRGKITSLETKLNGIESSVATKVSEAVTKAIEPFQAKITALEGDVSALKSKEQNFEKTVAEQVAKLGISAQAPATGTKSEEKPKLNLTQQCLQAKGLPLDTKF